MAKGQFIPQRPAKYIGDVNKILFRSSWELRFMKFCDDNINVLHWSSEEIKIPYYKPTDVIKPGQKRKVRHYYPDFYVEYIHPSGEVHREIVEIKPMKETKQTKKSSTYDKLCIQVNEAKWKAAKQYAQKCGMHFRVITEKSMFKTKEN